MRRNHYETAVIINAALDDEQIEVEVTKIAGIITDGGGVISETEKWGRKRLAYTINKNRLGYYAIYRYEAPVGLIAELERLLKIDESVVRFLTIRLEKEALEYFATRKFEADAAELEAAAAEVVEVVPEVVTVEEEAVAEVIAEEAPAPVAEAEVPSEAPAEEAEPAKSDDTEEESK